VELERDWSYADALDAHAILDAIEDAEDRVEAARAAADRELLALFKIGVDDKELKEGDKHVNEFAEKLEGLQKKLEKAGKVLAEAFGAERFYEFVKGTLEADAHLQDLATRLDVSANMLRSFGIVGQGVGLDLETSANAIGLFQKNLGAAAEKGGPAAAALAKLGIATKDAHGEARPMAEILGDVAEGLAKLPDQNARAAAGMELFGRAGRQLVPIFSKGREAFEEAMHEADRLGNGLGDSFYARVKVATEAFEHFQAALNSLKDRAIAALLPAITILGKALERIGIFFIDLDKSTHLIQTAFVTLGVIIGVGLAHALVVAGVALWGFLAPFLVTFGPAIAAVAALVWVFQDLWNAMTGAKSVLGDIIEKVEGVGGRKRFVAQLREAWDTLRVGINMTAYAVGYFLGLIVGLGHVSLANAPVLAFFDAVIRVCMAATRLLAGFFGMAAHGLAGIVKAAAGIQFGDFSGGNEEFAKAGKSADAAGEAVFGKKGILGEAGIGQHSTNIHDYGVSEDQIGRHATSFTRGNGPDVLGPEDDKRIARAQRAAGVTVRAPQAPHVGGNIVHQSNTNHVAVHTASDQPKAVGDAVGAGVATATQKDLNAALSAVVKP
jgi:hypothetical protein